ncbi:MAG: 5'/3'-nucleotidase SurE, partial [Oricola sp.]|nr:5'/3'-nucleotidase SurE [Oricola sp.]
MRILCTNDDGVYARGLESLVKIARELSDDVWVCAPQEEQSGAARALTLAHPVRLRQYDERRFAVSGTPSDAVLMGIQKVLGGEKPDLILSGVNNGQNLAEDVTVSGTIAGAFQGMSMGVPSVALSLSRLARDQARWETPEAHGAKIVKMLLE